ncbi:MAG: hypothetical protein J5589_05450 [Firmicutes bacterium]|nr:hypothetical protein [Bacillota bacterium]
MNCPNCNAPLGEGVLFCGQCGADLRNYHPEAAAPVEAAAEAVAGAVEQPWQQAPELDEELTVREFPAEPVVDPNAYQSAPQFDPNAIPWAPGNDPNAYQSAPQFDPNSIPPLNQDPGAYGPAAEQEKPKKEKKQKEGKKSKKPLIIAICAALGVALIALAVILILKGGGFSTGGSKKADTGFSKYALYFKDGELFYSDLKKEPWQVTDELLADEDSWGNIQKDDGSSLSSYVRITKDGKTIYYPDKLRGEREDGYTLFSRPLAAGASGEVTKIDSHVSSYMINEAGTLITYKSASGTLYQYDVKKGEKTKLATDISYYTASKDGKTVLYENEDYTLFAIPQGKDKIKISTDIGSYQLMDDGKTLYYTKNDALYRQVIGDDKEKIASDVYTFYIASNGSIYYIKMEEIEIPANDYIRDDKKGDASYDYMRTNLETMVFKGREYTYYYYDGKESTKIATSTLINTNSPGSRTFIDDAPGLICTIYELPETKVKLSELNTNTLQDTLWQEAKENAVKVVFLKDQMTEIGVVGTVQMDSNFDIYYQEPIEKENQKDASIYRMPYSGGSYKDAEEVAEDAVLDYWNIVDGKFYYFTDVNEKDFNSLSTADLYQDGKLLEADVLLGSVYSLVPQGKEVFYFTDYSDKADTVTIYAWNGSKSQMVAEDVGNMAQMNGDGILILSDYSSKRQEGDLNWYYNGKLTFIDDDVSNIIRVGY